MGKNKSLSMSLQEILTHFTHVIFFARQKIPVSKYS